MGHGTSYYEASTMTDEWNVPDLTSDTRSARARARIPERHRLLEHLLRNGSVTEEEARSLRPRIRRFDNAVRWLEESGVELHPIPEACVGRGGRPETKTRLWLASVPSGLLEEHDGWYGR